MPSFLVAIRFEPRNRKTGTSGSRFAATPLMIVVLPIPEAPMTSTPQI